MPFVLHSDGVQLLADLGWLAHDQMHDANAVSAALSAAVTRRSTAPHSGFCPAGPEKRCSRNQHACQHKRSWRSRYRLRCGTAGGLGGNTSMSADHPAHMAESLRHMTLLSPCNRRRFRRTLGSIPQSIPSRCTRRPCASALWCQRSISFRLIVIFVLVLAAGRSASDRGSIRVPIPYSDLLRDHGGEGFP